jgi:hypothetical protein
MRTKSAAWLWMALAFAAALALAAGVLVTFGAAERGTDIALQMTARFSFLLFWLAYTGGGLAVILGPAVEPVRLHGREFGLSFASAHLVHIGLVVWLCWIGAVPGTGVFLFFGPPLATIYVLALFSIRSIQQMIGHVLWRVLRTVGMTYIAYAFAADFIRAPLSSDTRHLVMYTPFAVLSIAGPVLHALSFVPQTWRAQRPRP